MLKMRDNWVFLLQSEDIKAYGAMFYDDADMHILRPQFFVVCCASTRDSQYYYVATKSKNGISTDTLCMVSRTNPTNCTDINSLYKVSEDNTTSKDGRDNVAIVNRLFETFLKTLHPTKTYISWKAMINEDDLNIQNKSVLKVTESEIDELISKSQWEVPKEW